MRRRESRCKGSCSSQEDLCLPVDGSSSGLLRKLSLMQEEELLFLQLPDWLLGEQRLFQDIKTKVPNKYGQMVL